MIQNETGFTWTAQRERAALLVAEDELSDEKIAESCGVKRVTLYRWKQHPEFSERVAEHVTALEAEMLKYSIAKRRKRIAALDDRWQRMQQVIEARSLDMSGVDRDGIPAIPGGITGLLVHQEKAIGTGQNQTIIDEYAVDTGLLRELRAHEEQAAKELGQWTEKKDLTSGGEVIKSYIGVDLDKV